MRMECQRILIHFLLLISNKFPAIANHCPLSFIFTPNNFSLIDIAIATQLIYSYRG